MRSMKTLFCVASVAVLTLASSSRAGLVLGFNGSTTPGSITLTTGSPTASLVVGVAADSGDVVIPNNFRLNAFGFRLRSSNTNVVSFASVSLTPPGAGTLNNTLAAVSGGGAIAEARADYSTNPTFPLIPGPRTDFISLATITLQLGSANGSVSITIEELTGPPDDVDFSTISTSDNSGAPVGQDSTIFSNNVGGFRQSLLTQGVTSSITAVPEPSSMLLVAGTAGLALARFRRRRLNVSAGFDRDH